MYNIVDSVFDGGIVEHILKFWFENVINYTSSHFPKGLYLWMQMQTPGLSIWEGTSVVWIKMKKFI